MNDHSRTLTGRARLLAAATLSICMLAVLAADEPEAASVPTDEVLIASGGEPACASDATNRPADAGRAVSPKQDAEAADAGQTAPAKEGTVSLAEGEQKVTESLQGKEGVRIQTLCTHCNSANVQVGGLNEDLVPMMRDGFPLIGGMATSMVLSFLPSGSIAEAQVAKGPGHAREPSRAAGGTVAFSGAHPEELPRLDLSAGGGSFGVRDGTIRAAGRLTDWLSASATAGRTIADPADDDGDGWNDIAGVEREFAEGDVRLRLGRSHIVQASASWIEEDSNDGRGRYDVARALDTFFSGGGMPGDPLPAMWTREDARLDRREFRVGWEWLFGGGGRLELRLLDGTRHQTVLSQETADPTAPADQTELADRLRINQRQTWGQLRVDFPLGIATRLSTGVEAIHDRAFAAVKPFGLSEPLPEEGEYYKTWSGFAELRGTPSARWAYEAGLRFDDDEVFGSQLSPRASLRFFPARGWTLRLLAGRTFRVPKSIFASVCCGQELQKNLRDDGSIAVQPEDATTWGFEGLYQPSPEWKASLYLAQTDFDDHILRLVSSSFAYVQTYAHANVPRARSRTAELSVTWKVTPWLSLDGSYGWLDFENLGDPVLTVYSSRASRPAQDIPVTIGGEVPYHPASTGSLSASFSLPRGISLAASASYTGSMWIQHFEEDFFAAAGSPEFEFLRQDLIETPGFWLVGLSADWPLGGSLRLVTGLDNLTDRKQNDLPLYTTDFNWGPLVGRSYHLGLRWSTGG